MAKESNFDGLTLFKDEIVRQIITDQHLLRAIANGDEFFLKTPIEKPGSLLYENIFPYKYTIKDTEETKKTFVTMSFSIIGKPDGEYDNYAIAIYVFTEKTMTVINDGKRRMLRVDYIQDKIRRKLTGSRDFGIGKLAFASLSDVTINNNFVGTVATYHTVDFAK